jgi:hypothetical protein
VVAQSVHCMTTDWITGVRSPAEAKDFSFSLCVKTSSDGHPASYPMVTGGHFQGVKCSRGVTLTTHQYLVPRSRKEGAILPLPLIVRLAVQRQLLLYYSHCDTQHAERSIALCSPFSLCCVLQLNISTRDNVWDIQNNEKSLQLHNYVNE